MGQHKERLNVRKRERQKERERERERVRESERGKEKGRIHGVEISTQVVWFKKHSVILIVLRGLNLKVKG